MSRMDIGAYTKMIVWLLCIVARMIIQKVQGLKERVLGPSQSSLHGSPELSLHWYLKLSG